MTIALAPATAEALPLHVLEAEDVALWAGQQSDRVRTWVETSGFKGGIGSALIHRWSRHTGSLINAFR